MARIRTIKPEFPQSESMGRVSRDARLTFIMLWTLADDAGRLRGNSRMLASLLFPYDSDASSLIDSWLAELDAEGCIGRYKIGSDSYIEIVNWSIHQKIDKPSRSKIPPRDDVSRIFSNPLERSSGDQGSRTKDQGVDQGPKESPLTPQGEHATASATPPLFVEAVNGKKPKKNPKKNKCSIPALQFTDEQQSEFDRVWLAWPSEGWDFNNKKAQPRRKDRGLAMRRFKEILDNCPHEIDGGPIKAEHLAEAAIAFVDARKREAQGAIPNVPCIANFFSSEEVSKKHWQTALLAHFGGE